METLRLYLTHFAGERCTHALDELVLVRDPHGFVEAYDRETRLAGHGYRFGDLGAATR